MPTALAWIMSLAVSFPSATAASAESIPPAPQEPEAPTEPPADPAPADPPVESPAAEPPATPRQRVSDDAPFEPLDLRSPDETLPPGAEEDWKSGYVRVDRPRFAGTGLFIASGISYFLGLSFQLGDALICGNCAVGAVERMFFAGAMGFSAGGGVMRAYADAYDDAALRRTPRSAKRLLIAGATLTAVGATLGVVNDSLWWTCVGGHGPYEVEEPDDGRTMDYPCRYFTARALLDVSTAITSAGLGMLAYALVYRRDTKMYERARIVGITPSFDLRQIGVQIGGRF